MYRKSVLVLVSVLIALVLAGCAEEQPESNASGEATTQGGGQTTSEATTSGTTSGGTTVTGGTTSGGTTMMGGTTSGGTTFGGTTVQGAAGGMADGEVAVGGFAVETPNAPDTTIPEVSASREDVQEYLNQVQPIVEDSVRDISNLVQPEARVENGNVTLDVEVGSLEEARNAVNDGLDELRNLEPPQGLEPINEQLIQSFERVQPAYEEIIDAANSGDAGRISDAIQENLPRIERFNAEARAILQDLEQAAGTQQ